MTARYCAARSCRTVVTGSTLMCHRHWQQVPTGLQQTTARRPGNSRVGQAARRAASSAVDNAERTTRDARRNTGPDEDGSWFGDQNAIERQASLFDDPTGGWANQQ